MSGMPPAGAPPSLEGLSATIASVVISRPAIEAACFLRHLNVGSEPVLTDAAIADTRNDGRRTHFRCGLA